MKQAYKLFLINMVIAFLPSCADAVTELQEPALTEPSNEPVGMFLVGVGLIGLALMVRKRWVK